MFDPPEARHDYHSKTPGPCVVPVRAGFYGRHLRPRPTAGRRRHPHHRPTHGRQPIAYRRRPDRRRPSCYHRVLSLAQWSGLHLAALLIRFLLRHFWPQGRIRLVGDDTVTEHPGPKVYGKARHRDAVRSSHSYTAWRWGHKWVVLAILVSFPFCSRPWALPVLVALYHSPQDDRQRGRRHRTPAQLLQLLLRRPAALVPRPAVRRRRRRRLRQPRGGVVGGQVSGAAGRGEQMPRRRQPVCAAAHAYAGKGRPRVKGAKLPTPQEVVAQVERQRLNVAWYGGGRRDVEVVSGTGHWWSRRPRSGRGALGLRPRRYGHAPG